MVPPGLADDSAGRALLGLSVLNYAHIGTEAVLDPLVRARGAATFALLSLETQMKPFYTIQSGYFRTSTNVVVEDSDPPHGRGKRHSSRLDTLRRAGWNPLRIALSLLPAPLYDHCELVKFIETRSELMHFFWGAVPVPASYVVHFLRPRSTYVDQLPSHSGVTST